MSGYAYNFPKCHRWVPRGRKARMAQCMKVESEAREAFAEAVAGDDVTYVTEILDTVHACETALREFPKAFVDERAAEVVAKNAARGYYGDGEGKDGR